MSYIKILIVFVVAILSATYAQIPSIFGLMSPADPHWSSVVLLIQPATSGSFADQSSSAATVTANSGAALSTAVSDPWGGSTQVIRFSGGTDYLWLADSPNWTYGTSPLTVEAWVRFNSLGSGGCYPILQQYQSTSRRRGMEISNADNNGLIFYDRNTTYLSYEGSDRTTPTNTWIHVAFVRNGSSSAIYVDGTRTTTATNHSSSSLGNIAGQMRIGFYYDGSCGAESLNGYIASVRITKGVARYSGSSFTSLKGPFPTH